MNTTTNIDLIDSNTTTNYTFKIEKDGVEYLATVYLNESGKFIDDTITHLNGDELDYHPFKEKKDAYERRFLNSSTAPGIRLTCPLQSSTLLSVMKNNNTPSNTQNYQLITINRYDIADSEVHVVTQEFLKNWLKLTKSNETEAPVASLRGGYQGLDSEEMSWLWCNTDKKVDAESQDFMDQHAEDFEEYLGVAQEA